MFLQAVSSCHLLHLTRSHFSNFDDCTLSLSTRYFHYMFSQIFPSQNFRIMLPSGQPSPFPSLFLVFGYLIPHRLNDGTITPSFGPVPRFSGISPGLYHIHCDYRRAIHYLTLLHHILLETSSISVTTSSTHLYIPGAEDHVFPRVRRLRGDQQEDSRTVRPPELR